MGHDDPSDLHHLLTDIQGELKALRQSRSSGAWKWWVGILAPFFLAAIIAAHATIWHLSTRVNALEDASFTVPQALRMEARIVGQIRELPITLDRLNDHEQRIRSLEKRRE